MEYPKIKNIELNETTFLFGPAIAVSTKPLENKLHNEIISDFEFDQ